MVAMTERRTKRSRVRGEALQFLVEALADRSHVPALVLLDDAGRIVAGMGTPDDVVGLVRGTRDIAWHRATAVDIDAATGGRDVTTRSVTTRNGVMRLAALGDRVTAVGDAVRAVQRILS